MGFPKRLFLRWALFSNLVLVALLIFYQLGWLSLIYALDATKLSFLILIVFAAAVVYCGVLSWRADKLSESKPLLQAEVQSLEIDSENGWFAAEICVKLGLTGTVLGFVMMLSGFVGFDGTDPQSTQNLIKHLSSGMSTAFTTTLVGVVCDVILIVQYHVLSNRIKRMKK
jgi:magnesium-transporting ATPase (P-type)